MLRPRRSLLAALLVLSVPSAFAVTLTVNTTTDDNADNSLCSLREAIVFFNKDRPTAGYQGCKASDGDTSTVDTLTLPADTAPYLIKDTALRIERSLTISGAGSSGDESVTTVKTEGLPHRAFVITATLAYQEPTPAATLPGLMTAPELDPTDTGKTGNNLTTNLTPPIIGALAAPAAVPKRVTLYSIGSDGSYKKAGAVEVAATETAWKIAPVFAYGLYKLVYTVRDSSEEEAETPVYSNQLNLAIYSTAAVEVTVQNMDLQGCNPGLATTTNCATDVNAVHTETSANGLVYTNTVTGTANNGGVIYTDVALGLTNVKISGGNATANGGAVYGDAKSKVGVAQSDIRVNGANNGAGIYIKPNSLFLSGSLLTENKAAAGGAIVVIESDTPAAPSTTTSSIFNLTVSGNTGTALSLSKDVVVNNSTIVNNSQGIEFNGKVVSVYNTILAGNPLTGTAVDCSGAAAAILGYSLVQTADGCQGAATTTALQTVSGTGTGKVLVDDGLNCADQPTGLLCRLAENGGAGIASHLPRILPGTVNYTASPFFNKGSPLLDVDSSCETTDQRGKVRPQYACDIGAIELQETTTTAQSGGVINYGQSYSQTLASDLGDEELLPAASCPATAPSVGAASQYTPTAKGCPWIEMVPTKGTVVFNTDGSYLYRPSSNFHGFDRFTVHVMTTYSALQTSNAKKSRLVQVTIVSEPSSGIKSDSVGAAGLFLLGGLLLLGFCTRGRRA